MQSSKRRSFWLMVMVLSITITGLLTWQFAPSLAARFRSLSEKANEETTEHEDREARERFFWQQRTYPNDTIPVNAREQAWAERPLSALDKALEEAGENSQLANRYAAQQANTEQWRALGPKPTSTKNQGNIWGGTLSGRVTSIAISPTDPSLVLVGRGGLWRSTDGGVNFTPVIDNLTQTYIHSIAFSRSTPSIVYAGLGDISYFKNYPSYLGYGVIRSNDAGRTWQKVSDATLPIGVIEKILVDPGNPERVYLGLRSAKGDADTSAESEPGFYFSPNSGQTWLRTFNAEITDIAIHPRNADVLFLGARQSFDPILPFSNAVYISKDRGLTWQLFSSFFGPYRFDRAFVLRLAPSPADTDRLVMWIAGVDFEEKIHGQVTAITGTQTANPQATTTLIPRGATCSNSVYEPIECFFQFGYDPVFAISPRDGNTLYYGGLHVYKSTDSGKTWTTFNKMHVDQHAIAFHPSNDQTVYFGNDGGLYKSLNGGTDITQLNDTLALTEFYQGYALHPTNANIGFGGTQDNGQQRRFNTWDLLAGGDGGGCVVNPVTTSTAICKYVGSDSFWRYDNYSPTVTKVSELPSPTFDADKKRLNFQEPFITDGVTSRIYFGSYRLLVSDNNGDTWSAPGGNQDLTKGTNVMSGGVNIGNDTISALAVPRTNPQRVVMTGSQFGRVTFSNNFGAGWLDFSAGLPNRSITSISFSPLTDSIAYVTFSGFGSGHVYKGVIANNAITWTNISGKLPDIPVNDLLVDPLNPTTLYVTTDIGVFRTANEGVDKASQGQDWVAFNRGLPNGVWAQSLVAQPEGTIQVTTWGRGVYQLDRPANTGACGLTYIRNETVGGTVSPTGCLSTTQFNPAPVKRFAFAGVAGQLVSVNASSTAFDAYLNLIAPNGTVLAQDDDSAGGLNPQIPARAGDVYTLPQTGNYIIEVTSNGVTAAGAFMLRLNGPLTPVKLDDGSVETALGGAGEFSFVNRITPASYPATINSMTILFSSGVGNKAGDAFTLLVGNNADGDEDINGTNFVSGAGAIKDVDKPTDYPFPGGAFTITRGDFVIGIRKAGGIAVDTNSTIQGRSYFSTNGTNFTRYVNAPGLGSGNFPIRADIVTQIGPLAAVSAASFRADSFAPEQIVALFGLNLATRTESANTVPLPLILASTTVALTDSLGVARNAPLFFVSAGQINFQIPPAAALGPATLEVRSGANNRSFGNLVIGGVAPGLFSANANGAGVPAAVLYRVRNGAVTTETISRVENGSLAPAPLDFGPTTDSIGFVLFGTGMRKFSTKAALSMTVGGVSVPLDFIGATPGLVGLDQINTGVLPRSLAGRGVVNLDMVVDGKPINTVQVRFQ